MSIHLRVAPVISPMHRSTHWPQVLTILGCALLVRLVFFNGAFGSDDTVYLRRAMELTVGDWSSANYNGALRYAFNMPAAAMLYLFGTNTAAANLWPLLCSLTEVLIVYLVATDIWGRKAGTLAALALAVMPLHISVASRIHADPVVSMFLSLGFALLYFGSTRSNWRLLLGSGLALGAVFWTKELAAVTLFAFLIFPVLWRRMPPGWLYVVAGGAIMLVAHLALMQVIAGDPFHLFKIALNHSFIREGKGDGSGWYYFRYLLLDLRHTGLASLLAFAAVVLILRDRSVQWNRMDGPAFAVAWFLSVLLVLSFFPISFSPLRFAMKQSNYLTMFLAPMAVLAGYALSRLPKRLGLLATALTLLGGLALAALQQADYRVFVSNSKAAIAFARAHPGHALIGSRNNASLQEYMRVLESDPPQNAPIHTFTEAAEPDLARQIGATADPAYIFWDRQTLRWMEGKVAPQQPLACWQRHTELVPQGLSASNRAVGWVASAIASSGLGVLQRLVGPLRQLAMPLPATVYTVNPQDLWCGAPPPVSDSP